MTTQSYKDLIVWQKSMDLVSKIYEITARLPKSEQFILTSQMLRAAISIPSNISEGYSRGHRAEFVQFLNIAKASASELETQALIVERQYKIKCDDVISLILEVQKILHVMIKKLKPTR